MATSALIKNEYSSATGQIDLSATMGIASRRLSDHLIEIAEGQWAIWKWICLRAAGFRSDLTLQLAAPACGAAADRILALESRVEETRQEALITFRSALVRTTDEQTRKSLHRALKQFNKSKVPEKGDPSLEIYRLQFSDLCLQVQDARNQFQREFQSSVLEISARVRKMVGNSLFCQAVLLQNREAWCRVVQSLMRHGTGQVKRGFKERQNDEFIANYLQRYCLKNDTIGFFGPVGWARVVPWQTDLVARPGPALVSSSSVHFENWCIEAVARKMAEDRSLRPWMIPRILPFFFADGNSLLSPGSIRIALSPLQAAVLKRCSGDKSAREIALDILARRFRGVRTESQVYVVLQHFESEGVISWSFEIPICLEPERRLRNLLEKIEKKELREPLLGQVNTLDEHRENIARAIGDADQLERALEDLDRTFTQLTGKSSSKSPGAMYASRTLTYLDCRRDLEVEIGAEIVASLGTPLSLLLTSARWFTYRAAFAYREAFEKLYIELSQKSAQPSVDLLQFWTRIEPIIFDPERRVFNEVISDFQGRWERILRLDDGARQVEYTTQSLKPLVDELFAAPSAGWQLARYHSPDVMIAAPSVEAIRQGDYHFVLGEIHMAGNTVRFSFAVSQHPYPEELFESIKRDLPVPRVLPVAPRQWPRTTNRTSVALRSPEDYYLELSRDSVANGPRSQVIPISARVIESSSDGRLVVVRESWSFKAADIPFINEEDEQGRYVEARRWMRNKGLPHCVFVKVPVEVKPVYVDFDSPIYVEILTKLIRRWLVSDRARENITCTEMLPDPDHLWLLDSEGHTYTSELRIIARDLVEF